MAFHLENTYTKDEILELYVNSIYFGDGYYCIYDASQGYFGKAPIDMTDYECTLLAGIPNLFIDRKPGTGRASSRVCCPENDPIWLHKRE